MTLDQFEGYLASALHGNMLAISEGRPTYPCYIFPGEPENEECPWFWMETEPTGECNYCILDTIDPLISDKARIAKMDELQIESYTYDLAVMLAPARYARMLESVNG